jgi:hypothetical protein
LNALEFEDLKADDNGVFVNDGLRTSFYQVKHIEDPSLRFYKLIDKQKYDKQVSEDNFMVRKYFFYHSTD